MHKLLAALFSLLLTAGGCHADGGGRNQTDVQDGSEPTFTSLPVNEFEKAIADTSVVRVDVRTMEEWAEGHIPGAIVLDVQKDSFLDKAVKTLPKDKTIAVYCRTGRRSKTAAGLLCGAGYKVIELNTGYVGWTDAGKPVTAD